MKILGHLRTVSISAFTATVPMSTLAASIITTEQTELANTTGFGSAELDSIIFLGLQTILGLLAIIVLVLIVYAGVLWMTAGGSEEKVQKAQGIIKNAIIGLLIIMASWGIVIYVARILSQATGTGVTS